MKVQYQLRHTNSQEIPSSQLDQALQGLPTVEGESWLTNVLLLSLQVLASKTY